MKVIIIDDEPKNIQGIRNLLDTYCKQVVVVGEALNGEEGILQIARLLPEVVLLDIQMPGMNGFEMLEQIGEYSFEVIFVTGFDQYAIQAIRVCALDFILKPVKPAELIKAINRAYTHRHKKQRQEQIENLLTIVNESRRSDARIALSTMKEIRFVSPDEIIRAEALRGYTRFHLINGDKLVISRGMHEFRDLLTPFGFITAHQAHMVNRKFVYSLHKADSIHELVLQNGDRVPVSRLKLAHVRDSIQASQLSK